MMTSGKRDHESDEEDSAPPVSKRPCTDERGDRARVEDRHFKIIKVSDDTEELISDERQINVGSFTFVSALFLKTAVFQRSDSDIRQLGHCRIAQRCRVR